MAGGKDDLARFAIRRLLPRRAEMRSLCAQIEERAMEARALGERVEQQEAQFESLRTRARAELSRGPDLGDSPTWLHEPVVAEEEVELELMRRRSVGGEGGR